MYPNQYAPSPDLARIFQSVDRDRSGNISAIELQQALSNGSFTAFNPETCRLMIGMFDRNGDASIDFQEFTALWDYINKWTQCFRSFDRYVVYITLIFYKNQYLGMGPET